MRTPIVAGVISLLIAMMPLAVLAQAATFDEETRATVVALAQRIGSTVAPGAASMAVVDDAPEPSVVEEPGAPAPEAEGPASEPTGEPTEEPVVLPELNLTDLVEYTSQGVTFQAPADWDVATDMGEDAPFLIEVPGTEVFISLEADAGLDFPSWLGVALFRSQGDLLISELGENAQIDESTTIFTEQALPVAKLAFSGEDNGEAVGGALFVTAPNENAYLLIAGGPADEWAYAAPGVDLIAGSLVFDEELVTALLAGDEPLLFSDEEETLEVTVPSGWYVMASGDPQFPVIVAEPEVRYVAAVGTEQSFGEDFDAELMQQFIPEEGELDPELHDDLFESILDMIASSGSPIDVDEALSSLVTRAGAVTVRLVGDADLGEGLSMPVVFYLDIRRDGAAVVAVFGDTESALAVEETLQALLESVTSL